MDINLFLTIVIKIGDLIGGFLLHSSFCETLKCESFPYFLYWLKWSLEKGHFNKKGVTARDIKIAIAAHAAALGPRGRLKDFQRYC